MQSRIALNGSRLLVSQALGDRSITVPEYLHGALLFKKELSYGVESRFERLDCILCCGIITVLLSTLFCLFILRLERLSDQFALILRDELEDQAYHLVSKVLDILSFGSGSELLEASELLEEFITYKLLIKLLVLPDATLYLGVDRLEVNLVAFQVIVALLLLPLFLRHELEQVQRSAIVEVVLDCKGKTFEVLFQLLQDRIFLVTLFALLLWLMVLDLLLEAFHLLFGLLLDRQKLVPFLL